MTWLMQNKRFIVNDWGCRDDKAMWTLFNSYSSLFSTLSIKLFYYIPQFNCLHTRRVVFCNYHFVEIFNILIANWQTNTPFIALSQISFVNNMSFRLCWWDAVWWLQNKEAARRCQANNWTEASPRPGLWEWQRQAGLGGTRHGSGQTNGSVYI